MSWLRTFMIRRSAHFRTEVGIEINYLREVFGDDAHAKALDMARDPSLRSYHRALAQEAAKQLVRPPAR